MEAPGAGELGLALHQPLGPHDRDLMGVDPAGIDELRGDEEALVGAEEG